MSISPGTHLGRYEILGLLGSGGMGEVYRARDTQLHRDVALKLLPQSATGDAVAELRFQRESRAIASVNHPNICAVHDVGVDAGRRYLIMELLQGETLQQRLLRGPFDTPDLVEQGIAVADALQTAHSRDVIHRDLKPANIFLTDRGQVKILDFGLAKAIDGADAATRAADDAITGKGTTVGTAAYMSPEQIRGESLDGRTDVFSLGLVLYEMATGRRAFSGSTGAAVAASILKDEVPPIALRPGLPPDLESVILKALEKDRDLRHQSAADLRADLKRVKRQLSAQPVVLPDPSQARTATPARDRTGTPPAAPSDHLSSSSDTQLLAAILSRRRVWAGAAGAALVLALVAAAWLRLGNRLSDPGVEAFSNLQIQPLTLDGMVERGAISPDGRFLVYQPYGQLAVRVRQISGETDISIIKPGRFHRIFSLTVTPDNNFVDVVAVTDSTSLPDAWRVPLLGGNPRQILRHVVSAIGWSPDGRTLAFVRSTGPSSEMAVVLADADGANQRELTTRRAPERFFGHLTASAGSPSNRPAWSPDGESLILAGYHSEKVELSELVILDPRTGESRRSRSMKGQWTQVTWLDETRLLLMGTDRLGAHRVWVSDIDGGHLIPITREFGFFMDSSVTADRTAAVVKRFTRVSGIWTSRGSGLEAQVAVPMSPAGAAFPSLDDQGGLTFTAFMPDGVAAVYHLPPGTSTPVRVVDVTAPPFAGRLHDVSTDGRTIVYTEWMPPHALFRVRTDGSERTRLVESDAREPRLTPDGQTVLFARSTPGLFSVPTAGGPFHKLNDRVISAAPASGRRAALSVSPDGTRVLHSTDKPGVIVLCDLPSCSNPRDLRLRSADWAPDGAGVAYVDVENGTTIMEQPLDGRPHRPIARLDGNEPIINFRWSPDGSRLATSRGTYPNDMVIIKGLRESAAR